MLVKIITIVIFCFSLLKVDGQSRSDTLDISHVSSLTIAGFDKVQFETSPINIVIITYGSVLAPYITVQNIKKKIKISKHTEKLSLVNDKLIINAPCNVRILGNPNIRNFLFYSCRDIDQTADYAFKSNASYELRSISTAHMNFVTDSIIFKCYSVGKLEIDGTIRYIKLIARSSIISTLDATVDLVEIDNRSSVVDLGVEKRILLIDNASSQINYRGNPIVTFGYPEGNYGRKGILNHIR